MKVPKKLIRLDTDFHVTIIHGPENLHLSTILLETMTGGRIALSPEQLEQLEAKIPDIKAVLTRMKGNE